MEGRFIIEISPKISCSVEPQSQNKGVNVWQVQQDREIDGHCSQMNRQIQTYRLDVNGKDI